MVTPTLPVSRISRQPQLDIASALTLGLSLVMTLTAACVRWPSGMTLAVLTAVTCEVSKVTLFSQAVKALRRLESWKDFSWGVFTLTLGVVFAAGSVAASVVCMSQSESTAQQQTLASSQLYGSAVSDLQALDTQITTLGASASHDVGSTFRARGLATLEKVETLRGRRDQAAAKVAALQNRSGSSSGGPLAVFLKALNLDTSTDVVDLTIEVLIGSAVELAALLFMWASAGTPTPPPARNPLDPVPPARRRQKREPFRVHGFSPVQPPKAGQIALPKPAGYRKTTHEASRREAAPPSYAKNLRYAFGSRTEALLNQLEGHPCHVGCRDLLQRMGEHCLRVSWTNGDIHRDTIKSELREGRDWRTISKYLQLLVEAGALALDGDTFLVAHFLAANPTVQRRTQRLLRDRNKNCKRQAKHRARLQSLQASCMQTVELTASSAARNAENPQPTTHAVQAAHAATHRPTVAVRSEPPAREAPAREAKRRAYGAVADGCSGTSDAEHEARMRRRLSSMAQQENLVKEAVPGAQRRGISAPEALEAAVNLEASWGVEQRDAAGAKRIVPHKDKVCIPVAIPNDPTPVNFASVAQACKKIGLPSFGEQLDDLFRVLSRESVRQPELNYAAYCTAKRRDKGAVVNPAAHLLAVIRRQRVAGSMA